MRRTLACFAALGILSAAQAATIDIKGYLQPATETDGEWGDNSSIGAGATPAPASDDDGTVTLTITTSGESTQGWNTAWSTGSYGIGQEWNLSSGSSATTAALAFDHHAYISITLDSTGNASDAFAWDTISASLWRNGSGADHLYQFAIDANADGFDVGDLVGSASSLGEGASNAETITYSGNELPDSSTSTELRLYHWGSSDSAGNFHLYNVAASYSVVPEPGTLALSAGILSLVCAWTRRPRRESVSFEG